MSTERFESLDDCWRHGTGAVVECSRCGHWRAFGNMIAWIKHTHLRPSLTFGAAAKRLCCIRCGAKFPRVFPGDAPHPWKGNR
jgi:hypothetical protein